jgi:hypothetical protein
MLPTKILCLKVLSITQYKKTAQIELQTLKSIISKDFHPTYQIPHFFGQTAYWLDSCHKKGKILLLTASLQIHPHV